MTAITQPAALATRDRLARLYMPEADALARAMARRLRGLAELEDLQQEARFALVQAAARVTPGTDPRHYFRRSIAGALRHYVRDRLRLVRVSRRAHEAGGYPLGHFSLDAPMTEGGPAFIDLLEAPEPEDDAPRDALAAAVAQMAERLPAADAAALRLLMMEGRSIREAAAILGTSSMTASRRRDRAVDAIRYALGA
jgi:RNA polymerase sigma-B factor